MKLPSESYAPNLGVAQAEVWDLPKVCKSFPEFDGKLVDRGHLLTQVEAFFDQGHKLVLFDGEQGAGSTTLLAQFALAHPTNTFFLVHQNYQPHRL